MWVKYFISFSEKIWSLIFCIVIFWFSFSASHVYNMVSLTFCSLLQLILEFIGEDTTCPLIRCGRWWRIPKCILDPSDSLHTLLPVSVQMEPFISLQLPNCNLAVHDFGFFWSELYLYEFPHVVKSLRDIPHFHPCYGVKPRSLCILGTLPPSHIPSPAP